MKKKLLTSLFVAFSVCMGVSTACLAAGADDAAITVDNANVTMVQGASARISDDGYNGLRYTMTTSVTDYQGLKATYGENVSFGILIAPKAYDDANELNEANVFGAEAVYDWAEWDEATETYVYSGNKTRIINLSSATMKAAENDENTYVLYGAIANLKAENITKEFVGVGYIAYGDGETTNYKFLADNDNARSMAYVAQVYQTLDGVEQETKDLVKENYITGKADQEDTFYTVNHMRSDGNGGYTVGETEQVTAKINETTVAPTAKTFDGYCYDATNANNSAGGDIVYANGKTTANLYYTNDWNKNFVKNADGSYSMTTAGRVWSGGPAWSYTYTTQTPATTAVYSVKMEANQALSAGAWGQMATGIAVTQGERIADADTTFYEWVDTNASQRTIPMNSIYGTVFGSSCIASKDIQIMSSRGMGYCSGFGSGTLPKLSADKNELILTVALYKNVFYIYVDGNFVGTRNVNDSGDWNGLVAIKTSTGEKYGYTNDVGFRFGMGNYNGNTDVKFTVVTEKYGDDAIAEMNANTLYKYSILIPMTVNMTKNANGTYTAPKGWQSYGYAYTTTTAATTAVYSVKVTGAAAITGSNYWSPCVGITVTNGTIIDNQDLTYTDFRDGTRTVPENTFYGTCFGLTNDRNLKMYSGKSMACKNMSAFATHLMLTASNLERTLTLVLYKDTFYFYIDNTLVQTVAVDDAGFQATKATTSGKTYGYAKGDAFLFGISAHNEESQMTFSDIVEKYGADALTELTTNSIYASIGATAGA